MHSLLSENLDELVCFILFMNAWMAYMAFAGTNS